MAASIEMSFGDTKEKETCDDLSLFVDISGVNLNLDLLQKTKKIQVTFVGPLNGTSNKDPAFKYDPLQQSAITILTVTRNPKQTVDSDSENSMKPEKMSIMHGQDSGSDNLLNSLNNITDYDWLLSPRSHLLSSSETEEQITLTDHILISNGQSTSPEFKQENTPADGTPTTTNTSIKLPASSSNGVKSSSTIRGPSPSRKAPPTGSRSATPTTKPTITKSLRSSTPTSRASVTAATKPVAHVKRSTTPTPRPTPLAVKSKPTSRSSTPLQRLSILPAASKPTSRSSTPVQRPSIIANAKSASRSSTPTQRPSTTSAYGNRSSSAMKSRPSKNPPETLDRSASASRGRPGPPTAKLPVTEINLKAVPKRTSCSPSRGHGGVKSGMTRGRGHSNGDDDVNPVLMGTKMVERVVNMRKLAPPRHDDVSNQNNTSGKLSVSQDSSGFGRSLSKKSFDMALRHLDIRRSMPGNMRATITKIPASSVYSVRPDSTKTRTTNASDSPLATSSSASSDESGHSYPKSSGGSGGFPREP